MKTDQITTRISSELKQQLRESAERHGVKTAEFIRLTLESAVDSNQDDIETRLDKLEENIHGSGWSLQGKIVIKALAVIVSMDKNMPIDRSLFIVSSIASEAFGPDPITVIQLPRDQREKTDTKIFHKLQSNLNLSSTAVLAMSLIVTTFLGMVYQEDIFQLTEFSMQTMQNIRDNLE